MSMELVPTKKRSGAYAGYRIKLANGTMLSDLARKGIALQRQGIETEIVAKRVGLSICSYNRARDMVLLSERDDLGDEDAKIVRQALHEVDEQRQIARPWERVKPIAMRVFGIRGNRLPSPRTTLSSDRRRSRRFEDAISFIAHTCTTSIDIQIPPMPAARAAQAEVRLKEAQNALQKLKSRIRKEAMHE